MPIQSGATEFGRFDSTVLNIRAELVGIFRMNVTKHLCTDGVTDFFIFSRSLFSCTKILRLMLQ